MSEPISFPSSTSTFSLPLLFSGQAQKEFFVNQSLSMIDALMQSSVIGSMNTPPTDPVEGDVYRITDLSSGEWDGRSGQLAMHVGGAWLYLSPPDGLVVFDRSARQLLIHAEGWQAATEPSLPDGGSIIDSEARSAIGSLIEALRKIGVFSDLAE